MRRITKTKKRTNREGAEFRELMSRIFRTRTEITFEMLQVLSCLWHEQGITRRTLAERTAKGKACLTSLMNNLEKRNYVCRREDPDDQRGAPECRTLVVICFRHDRALKKLPRGEFHVREMFLISTGLLMLMYVINYGKVLDWMSSYKICVYIVPAPLPIAFALFAVDDMV